MRKFTHLDSLDHPRRRRSKAPLVLLFVLILIATPPMFEVGKIEPGAVGTVRAHHAGRHPSARLPQHALGDSHGELRDWSTPLLVNRRWNPKLVIPFAFFWTAVAALMLRRGH